MKPKLTLNCAIRNLKRTPHAIGAAFATLMMLSWPSAAVPMTVHGDPFELVASSDYPNCLAAITADGQGKIYVGNNSNGDGVGHPLQRFDPATYFPGSPDSNFQAFGANLDDADGLAFGNGLIFAANLSQLRTIPVPAASPVITLVSNAGYGTFGSPIVFHPRSAHLLVGAGHQDDPAQRVLEIREYDLGGTEIGPRRRTAEEVETMTLDPNCGSQGCLYYSPYDFAPASGTRIRRLDLAPGGLDELISTPPENEKIDVAMHFDPLSGFLFYAPAPGPSPNRIYVVDPANGSSVLFATGFTGEGALGLFREPLSGDLYYLECGNLWRLASAQVTPSLPPIFVNPPASTNLGCNPVSVPDCDPMVRAIDNCATGTNRTELLVSSYLGTGQVKRFNGATGAFIDTFAPDSSGLNGAEGVAIGPDGNLYVSSYYTSEVKRYSGITGEFLGNFVSHGSGGLSGSYGLVFGTNGNLYVSSYDNNSVCYYDGKTGAPIGTGQFISAGSGLNGAEGLVFGPDGNLYVSSSRSHEVKRYNGVTGAFMDTFVTNSGAGDVPAGLTFGPDRNLYVSMDGTHTVKCYDGTSGFPLGAGGTGIFVSAGSGGLDGPYGLAFGPDTNLYVVSLRTSEVLRYDGLTGAFIDRFVTNGSGGLYAPTYLVFAPYRQSVAVTCAEVDAASVCAHTRTITYTAVDSCNNSNTYTQIVSWSENTNPPVVVQTGDKTVDCASIWNFDLPSALDACSGTNVAITTLGTVTNGSCPKLITRTWLATDQCGNTNLCSQTVTLQDTSPPIIHCPVPGITRYSCDNSMRVYYSIWAYDNCSGYRTVTCDPPSGSVFPVGASTVNCTAIDACGNVGTSNFTVTVINRSPTETRILGQQDCFLLPKETAVKSSQLLASHAGARWNLFDDTSTDRSFGASFLRLPSNINCGLLSIRLKPSDWGLLNAGSWNDTIALAQTTDGVMAWTSFIGGGNASPGLIAAEWRGPMVCGQLFNLNLADLSAGQPGSTANVLSTINSLHQLDIYVQDDTAVDYAQLTYCYCPPPNPVWGNSWSLLNAEMAPGNNYVSFTQLPALGTSTNFTATFAPGATRGIRFGLPIRQLGFVTNATLAVTASSVGKPVDTGFTFTGVGNGDVNVALSAVGPEVTLVQATLLLQGVEVAQSLSAGTNGSAGIVILNDGEEFNGAAAIVILHDGVDQVAGPNGIAIMHDGVEDFVESRDGVFTVTLSQPGPIRYSLGSVPVTADQVRFTLVDGTRTPDNLVTSFSLSANGLSEVQLSSTAVLIGDAWAEANGDVSACADGDQLNVTPSDSTAPITIAIHVPQTNQMCVNLQALQNPIAAGPQNSGVVTAVLQGVVDANPIFAATFAFVQNNGGWDLSSDFSSLGSAQQYYEIYSQGMQTASLTWQGTPHMQTLPLSLCPTTAGAQVFFHWPTAQDLTLNGIHFAGDELRVAPVAPTSQITTINEVDLSISGLDGVSVSATLPPPFWQVQPPQIDNGEVSVEWTGPPGGVLESAAALSGPWTVVTNQTSYSALTSPILTTNATSAHFFRVRSN